MTSAVPDPESAPATASPARRDPAVLVVLGLIVLLVVVALVVVFSRGEPTPLAADTPGGVVQRYATAVLDGDEAAAAKYLSAGALADCADTGSYGTSSETNDTRVALVDTVERDSNADVLVRIVRSSGTGPFGASEYESEDSFALVRAGAGWLIDEAPWQLAVCPPTTEGETP